jgi:protein arginine kinase activator
MLCEICKKNPATVHLTEISQGVKKELHMCDECAKQKGLVHKVSISVPDMISKMIEPMLGKTAKEMETLKCARCGMSFSEFRSKSRFGCANDYEVFKKGIIPLLEKIHGSAQHIGKVPVTSASRLKVESELIMLKRELDHVIKAEDFEKAAQIRDKIKELEAELQKKQDENRGSSR